MNIIGVPLSTLPDVKPDNDPIRLVSSKILPTVSLKAPYPSIDSHNNLKDEWNYH